MLSFNLGGTSNPLGGGASTTTAATATGSGATVLGAAQPGQQQQQQQQQSTLSFRVLEDYINKWMGELDLQEKDFLNQATQLNALDKLMIDNGEKVSDSRLFWPLL